ncbi:MAG: recombination protein O N-terminal domain-containing protein [Bacteroidales bacterium]|nr:recombination protein O N-terminal domain-containing protein [Bacteroidales bacterium]
MQQTIEGIILKRLPYNDTFNILYLYTLDYGFMPAMIKKKTNPKNNHAAFIFPLNIINANIKLKPQSEIQFISNLHSDFLLLSIRDDFHKISIVQFMSEVLYQLLKYPHSEYSLYSFIKEWIIELEHIPSEQCNNYHFIALIKLLNYLGIEPENNFSTNNRLFDIPHANFTTHNIYTHNNELQISELWHIFLSHKNDELAKLKISRKLKQSFLNSIFSYYHYHLDTKFNLNSLETLNAIYENLPF